MSATEAPAPTAQSGSNPDSDSGSDQCTSSSTTESDTDENASADWKVVPFAFLLTDELITKVRDQRKLQLPQRLPSPTFPAPVKLLVDGDFKYVDYIPVWTHPEWDDNFIVDKATGKVERKIFGMDTSMKRRPALLQADEIRNPTPYARRWGIEPGRTDGRSRLSPTDSSTRRTGLSEPLVTADNQLKYFLTGQDLSNELMAEANKLRVPVSDFLAALRSTPITIPEDSLFHELYRITEEDKDFQRIMFQNLTTDEV